MNASRASLFDRGKRSLKFRLKRHRARIASGVDRERRLRLCNRFGFGGRPTGNSSGTVVSMTTYPPRFDSCHVAVESILHGRVRPAQLILWIFEGDLPSDGLPRTLKRLERRGVSVRLVTVDFGPANKLVHTLRAFPDRTIVTADDDILYPRRWLADLERAASESPNVVVAHRAHHLTIEASVNERRGQRFVPYAELMLDESEGLDQPIYSLLPLGVSGVLYPPGSVHESVHDHAMFTALSRRNDDIWFKAMTLMTNSLSRRVTATNSRILRTIRGSQGEQLAAAHVDGGQNDLALPAVFDHYELFAVLRAEQAS